MVEAFKLTCWNIEWADRLVSALESATTETRERADLRISAIAAEIAAMAPDILVVGEGPKGEARAQRFFGLVAPQHDLVLRGDDRLYKTRGQQWVWFLVRRGLADSATLLHIDRWRDVTREASFESHDDKWMVGMPKFIVDDSSLRFDPEKSHTHYRHPQALQLSIDGQQLEVIGAHLKSKKINVSTPPDIGSPGSFIRNPEFVAEVIEARVKLSSEATDIRYYLDGRFTANVDAAIIVAGDFNDGPGKEMIEERFLLHDLIGNLQGEVFFARRFLNHALFDFEGDERWTVQFHDKLDPRRPREILLDHILFSQSMVGEDRPGACAFRAVRQGGLVEHAAHHAANATLPSNAKSSDHRPVSMHFQKRPVA